MNENGMDQASMETVHNCATSYEGQTLLNQLGDETNSLNPEHTGVPWVTFNGVSKVL